MALDRDAARFERVRENLDRLRAGQGNVLVIAGDAGTPSGWWDGRPFDRILADVPCTASGIVRRHPDAKWLRRKSDLTDMAGQQRRILKALWPLLAPGGRLLYATCSVFAGENELRVREFLAETPEALRETIRFDAEIPWTGELLPSGKGTRHNQDGFSTRCSARPDEGSTSRRNRGGPGSAAGPEPRLSPACRSVSPLVLRPPRAQCRPTVFAVLAALLAVCWMAGTAPARADTSRSWRPN